MFQALKTVALNGIDLVPKGIYDTAIIDPQTKVFTQQTIDSLKANGYITLEFDVDDLAVIEEVQNNKNEIDILQGIDKRSTFLTKDENGNVSKVEIKDDEIIIQTTNIFRDSQGNVLSVSDVLGEKTVTTTINRSNDGGVISISKAVE